MPVLCQVLGIQRNAVHKTLASMEREGLVRSELVSRGFASLKLISLTPHGAAMAVDPADVGPGAFRYHEPGRVAESTLAHGIDCQLVRLALERAGWQGWKSDLQNHRDVAGNLLLKAPDAIATDPEGSVVAIEVERTIKSKKRYETIISQYLQMVRTGTLSRVFYISFVPGVAARLEAIFNSIEAVPVKSQRVVLRDDHRTVFSFKDFSTK